MAFGKLAKISAAMLFEKSCHQMREVNKTMR